MKKINKINDISWYSTDLLWVWIQVREIYEKLKNDIKKIIFNK